jgi:hypothetical protein
MICGPSGPNGQGCAEVFQLDLNPTKKEILSYFGYPTVRVELDDEQLEVILRTTGQFIAGYFPHEEKIATFYTTPLKNEYDLPPDGYWIKAVKWDPAVTRVGDIFGAESFLFCFADCFKILRSDNELVSILDWKDDFKCKTPFGNKKAILNRHECDQELVKIIYDGGDLVCTPNHPIKIDNADNINDWITADECEKGTKLVIDNGVVSVIDKVEHEHGFTTTIYVPSAHCFYGCSNGIPVLVH